MFYGKPKWKILIKYIWRQRLTINRQKKIQTDNELKCIQTL